MRHEMRTSSSTFKNNLIYFYKEDIHIYTYMCVHACTDVNIYVCISDNENDS